MSRLFRLSPPGPLAAVIVLAAGLALARPASAQEIVRVEEDWVVELGKPDPDSDAPQLITAMSSTERLEDVHAVFELNHTTLPAYAAGGLQLQIWSGDTNLTYGNSSKSGKILAENEVVTYTMSMKVSGGNIEFNVLNGESTTWGQFGRQGYLKAVVSTPQTNLSRYAPDISVKNSKVGYAKHRVKKFYLKEVRYYTNGSTEPVEVDETERVVHQLTSN